MSGFSSIRRSDGIPEAQETRIGELRRGRGRGERISASGDSRVCKGADVVKDFMVLPF